MSNDRDHFDEYKEQTRLKHEILSDYLPAYFHLLKRHQENLVYLDAFAGRGIYRNATTGEEFAGSPIRALQLICGNPEFTRRVSTIFVEADGVSADSLEAEVGEFTESHPDIRRPLILRGAFADQVGRVLDEVNDSLAPCFLFVDPCGISGVDFATVRRVMQIPRCEAFIFFNVNALRRVAGLDGVNQHVIEMYGSEERAARALRAHANLPTAREREDSLVEEYRLACIEEMNARYVIPFRVEHEQRRTVSHYFLHVSKHPRGFSIMKDVMWRRGRTQSAPGGLELEQASHTGIEPLFQSGWDEFKAQILRVLRSGDRPTGFFYNDCVNDPEDRYSQGAYRLALLELEATGRVEAFALDSGRVVGPGERPKRQGAPTLSARYGVRAIGQ